MIRETTNHNDRLSEDLHLAVILAFGGVTLSDVAGVCDVFDIANGHFHDRFGAKYRTVVASVEGGPVRTSCGVTILTEPLGSIDTRAMGTLFVPGAGPPSNPPLSQEIVDWLRRHGQEARRICAICTGAFLVAEAGLANYRRLTTHWDAAAALAARYPLVDIQKEPIFVRDGALWSSAGFSAGVDMALALLEADYGYATAIEVSRQLVVFLKRTGDQSQYSRALAFQSSGDADFSRLHAWVLEHLGSNLNVDRMAEHMGISPRTFARRYMERYGRTPAKMVESLRVEAAVARLREGATSLKQVARESGFGDEQRLRRAFVRNLGALPNEFQARGNPADARGQDPGSPKQVPQIATR